MSTVKRVTLSLPVDVAEDLNYIHRRIGVSRSVFVSTLLSIGLKDFRGALEQLPDNPSPDDLLRFRGTSAALARDRVQDIMGQIEGTK